MKKDHPSNKEKQQVLKHYGREYGLSTFVETGTFKGKMVEALVNDFRDIYSIELDDDLWHKAHHKFSGYDHVKILKGDSKVVLKEIVDKLKYPSLFWLDAHYSGRGTAKGETNSPIEEELSYVLGNYNNHVILIDDSRLFEDGTFYPKLGDLTKYIASFGCNIGISIRQDIIRIVPVEW